MLPVECGQFRTTDAGNHQSLQGFLVIKARREVAAKSYLDFTTELSSLIFHPFICHTSENMQL